ncbi:MAG: hypothetical protein HOP22_13160 [Nitrospiraceae bacterium]|jgi:hypothetical protein|nr:hypothetical protein [Nitrospiraceae bacterium]
MPGCHGLTERRFNRSWGRQSILSSLALPASLSALALLLFTALSLNSQAWAQSISSVRSFDGGVAPLFTGPGSGSLYLDNQGTQGFLYNPGNNFQSFSFRNPTTGQAWSGAVNTLGPQLSIGLIQGANQTGSARILPGPPRQTAPLPSIQSTILDEIP